MSRKTVYNKIVDENKIKLINSKNKELQDDFLDYLDSIDRSPKTIYQYNNDLNIFFVWNLEFNNNKFFVDIKKREIVKFQKYVLNDLGWSPARIKRVKSCLSSLSNYIENILDDEFEDFRSVVNKIESPVNEKVREKSVIPDDKIELLLHTLTKEEKYEQACAVAIALYSGMRKAELLQMKTSYFNKEHLGFDNALYITDKIRTKGRGKQGKLLNKYVLVEVQPYLDKWLVQRDKMGVDIDDLFVVLENDKWVKRKTIDYWVSNFSKIIGMPFYFHALRHKLTTMLVNTYNIPMEVVREYFGWNDVAMVSLYNDVNQSENFGKYFTSEGVKKQEENNIFK